MIIGSISEDRNIEKRVAITPDIIKKYKTLGLDIKLIKNYGSHLGISDKEYEDEGASILKNDDELKNSNTLKKTLDHLDIIYKDLISIFLKNNIKPIESLNKKLDPNLHQAMMEIEDDQKEPGTIIQEIQKGFTIKDRLLRPSLVGVSKKIDQKQIRNETREEMILLHQLSIPDSMEYVEEVIERVNNHINWKSEQSQEFNLSTGIMSDDTEDTAGEDKNNVDVDIAIGKKRKRVERNYDSVL